MDLSTEELLASMAHAVEQNDQDSVISLTIELGFARRPGEQALDTIIDAVLQILGQTATPGNECGFQILFWIAGQFGELNEASKDKIKQFVAENYGKFRDIVAEEMADFVGGFRDDWGIGVVSDWIANYETFTCDAARSIDTAIREFQDHPAHMRSDDVYRVRVQELAIRLREKRRGITSSAG